MGKRPNLSAAVLEFIRTHPGCYASDVVDALQSQFPDRKRKTLQSVPAQLRFQGRVHMEPGKGYFVRA